MPLRLRAACAAVFHAAAADVFDADVSMRHYATLL